MIATDASVVDERPPFGTRPKQVAQALRMTLRASGPGLSAQARAAATYEAAGAAYRLLQHLPGPSGQP